jgi:serine/threonine-protein kinase
MDIRTFVKQLQESGLLSDKKLERAVRELHKNVPDGRFLARELIARGLLTPYQANHLLTGKGKNLVLGQYRIVERLGQSVTGQTFRAVHATMGRMVVLRLLSPHLTSDPKERSHFTREVQTIAQLSHTNILTAFDAFELEGTYVLVMEYVEGMDIVALVQHVGMLPIHLACNFGRQTALGMQHAHERGIGCCNIKPENILIAGYSAKPGGTDSSSSAVPRGVVKILNVGLAYLNEESTLYVSGSVQRPDQLIGPADYLAPELAHDRRLADIRSDIYALGCIIYFSLAGHPPFPQGTPQQKIQAHLTQQPAPIESLRPDVNPQLAAVLRRMMAKRPTDRQLIPAEVANDLMPFCVSRSRLARQS